MAYLLSLFSRAIYGQNLSSYEIPFKVRVGYAPFRILNDNSHKVFIVKKLDQDTLKSHLHPYLSNNDIENIYNCIDSANWKGIFLHNRYNGLALVQLDDGTVLDEDDVISINVYDLWKTT